MLFFITTGPGLFSRKHSFTFLDSDSEDDQLEFGGVTAEDICVDFIT